MALRGAMCEALARKHLTWWYRRATHSLLPAMLDKARMLKVQLPICQRP